MLTGNLPDKVLREIYRPEKQFERHSLTKKYMKDFFLRNLSRPNKELELPTYLLPFKFPEQERFTEELFSRLKQGKYDIKKEERQLAKLAVALNQRGDQAEKLFGTVGLFNLKRKLEDRQAMLQLQNEGKFSLVDSSFFEE